MMLLSRKTIFLIVFSLLILVVWIGYTVYANLFVHNSAINLGTNQQYLTPLDTSMHLDTLKKVQDLQGNIKVTNNQLTQN